MTRIRRRLVRLLGLTLLLAPATLAAVVYLAFDRRPAVERPTVFTPDHVERAKRILDANDPRRLRTGLQQTVAVSAEDLDLAMNYLAQRYGDGGATSQLEAGRLHVRGSLHAAALPSQPYLNLDVQLVQGTPLPEIARFRVGALPLPAPVVRFGLRLLLSRLWSADDLALMTGAIKALSFDEQGVRLTYEWHRDLMNTVRTALLRPEDRDRLKVYQEKLAEVTAPLPPRQPVALTQLLAPLFAVAAERSRTQDPVAENRAAIVVLTFYVDGRSLRHVVPEAETWARPSGRGVQLSQRSDFAQHFMISAALSANTGGPFADAVGIYKEVSDSRGGSGFSFDDIAADRSGSRVGQWAERASQARQLQERLAATRQDAEIVPATSDLPQGLPEAEFVRQYGGVGAPGYQRLIAQIDARIDALRLFREP